MVNKWIDHVRQFAKENGLSYACALSTAECKASYNKVQKVQKVQKVVPQDKAFADLSSMVEQAKKMKPKTTEPRAEPQGVVVKRRLNFQKINQKTKAYGDLINIAEKAKQMKPRFEVPITFIQTNFKKKSDLKKAEAKAEAESEDAMTYLSSFQDESRHHYKQLIFNIIQNFEEIHKIEDELKEPNMSPNMVASRKARIRNTELELADSLDELRMKGFVPTFL
jgi:hypothetical protein